MRRAARRTSLVLVLAWCAAGARARDGAPRIGEITRDGGVIYEQMCANCHGTGLGGGKGGSLLGGALKHGDSDESLTKSIRDGFPATGMPAFGQALNEAEIRAVVVHLRERLANQHAPEKTEPIDANQVRASELHSYRIETIVDQGLEVPWSFVFFPDKRILVTERAGRLRIIDHGQLSAPIEGVPTVIEKGEGGLMSVALHPDFTHNHWVYLAFSDPGEGETAMTKVVRARFADNRLTELEPIFSVPKENYPPGYVLFGCRMEFLGDHLFFSIGERGVTGDAQKPDVPTGKIHRVLDDGRIPPDNPYAHTPGVLGTIWAIGVRNPQGLAFDPVTHALWETEHGPRGGDELNLIEPGKNYGWPVITHGINYDGTAITDQTAADGMEQPVRHWTPSIATSQIAFYTGDRFPKWKNHLFLGSLAQQKFIRIELDGKRIIHEEELFKNLGRIRDIKTGPDGYLYLALEQLGGASGRIVRLVPVE